MKSLFFGIIIAFLSFSAQAQWKYKTEKNSMTDEIKSNASLLSSNKLQFSFPYNGGATGKISIRQSKINQELKSLFTFEIDKGQILKDEDVLIRFNDDSPIRFSADYSTDGSRNFVFLNTPGRKTDCTYPTVTKREGERPVDWITRLEVERLKSEKDCAVSESEVIEKFKNAEKIKIQVTVYDEGNRVFEFKSKGLKLPD